MDKKDDMLRALALPFERGDLVMPERAFWLRAEAAEPFAPWRSRLDCEQSFKPAHDRLLVAGFRAAARLEGPYAVGLCLLGKHKGESRALMARGLDLLAPGGVLVCCGANALGAASLEKEAAARAPLHGSLSKHQCRVFWLGKTELPDWRREGEPRPVGDSGLVARAGCFSAEHVDSGSRLLAACLPPGLSGRGADLGAGWGYLSADILARFDTVTHVDLYEAEALALDDARANLAAQGARAGFHWCDVTQGVGVVEPYDWIVSNPPFHDGGRADPAIGQAFITAAWKAIRRRGKFFLVANRHLPYEAELRRRFRDVALLAEADGFKVYLSSNRHDG